MKEISKASGGTWGGNTINSKILEALSNKFVEQMQRLRRHDINSYMELKASIESTKREYNEDDEFILKLPEAFFKGECLGDLVKMIDKDFEIIEDGRHILFSDEMIAGIFKKCMCDITKHVDSLLHEKDAMGVSVIILVGGYATSTIVQTAFKENFGKCYKVIIPQNPEIVVLTGAVISGHSIEPITGRVAKYNYGFGIRAAKSSADVNLLVADSKYKKIFHPLIEKGGRMDVGKNIESCKISVQNGDPLREIELYKTNKSNPEPVINSIDFEKIGAIKFSLPILKQPTVFLVSLYYDETEFRVIAKDEQTNADFVGMIKYFE